MSTDSVLTGTSQYSVYYEDTDFSGYVYHANYLKYFERGREDLVGLKLVKELYERGVHFVVANMELSFKHPARHGDTVEVATKMKLSASPVGVVEQEARLPGGRTLVTAKIKLVCVDKTGEPIRVPDDVLTRFNALTR